MKTYYVYIVSNKTRTVFYTGVTNDLERRVYEHKNKLIDGYSKKYNCSDLIFFEEGDDIASAIEREKEIKGWKRIKKDHLVQTQNPKFKDLAADWFERSFASANQHQAQDDKGNTMKNIFLAAPRGFCAGVERAILIVDKAIEKFGTPIYVNHEIVHNQFVVEEFEKKGVIFTADIEKIPTNSVYIFSAHGISPKIRKQVEDKNLQIIDATCPLVTKVHWEAEKFNNEGYYCFYIGQANHQEYLGVKGVAPLHLLENKSDVDQIDEGNFKDKKVVCLTQTTLSEDDTKDALEALKTKLPHLRIPGDICYATTNRQESVKALCQKSDFIIVIGSQNSSNSQKLVHVAQKEGTPAQLFENADTIPNDIFAHENIGITSGASVPEVLIEQLLHLIKTKNPEVTIQKIETKKEDLAFPLPKVFL